MDGIDSYQKCLDAYLKGFPFQTEKEAKVIADGFNKYAPGSVKHGDVFSPLKTEEGWNIVQSLKDEQ